MNPMNGTSKDESYLEMKIPGGKLLGCRGSINGGRLDTIRFTGDFFMHPEEAVEELEGLLSGKDMDEAIKSVKDYFQTNDVEMAGVSPNDFIEIIKKLFQELL